MSTLQGQKLTLEDFHARYDGEKPYYEYWDGEAVQKAMPKGIHSVIQIILGRLLYNIGFKAGSELRLKISKAYEPVPDLVADTKKLPYNYITSPCELIIEILSPDDSFSRTLRKCNLYEGFGFKRILIVDPSERVVWLFQGGTHQETDCIAELGGRTVTAAQLWTEVDQDVEPA